MAISRHKDDQSVEDGQESKAYEKGWIVPYRLPERFGNAEGYASCDVLEIADHEEGCWLVGRTGLAQIERTDIHWHVIWLLSDTKEED